MDDSRATHLERLRSQRFDLLVVGGGIIGAGVAELASRHGFAVALAGPLEPLADGIAETEAEVLDARAREWALTAEDVLRRRTTLALTGGRDSPAVRERVDALLQS